MSYNTLAITLQMIFSMYRVLNEPPQRIVVVENGSTDGSQEFLMELHRLGLVHVVRNTRSNQHGPGLNRGLDEARRLNDRASLIWVVDSDVFVAKAEALEESRTFLAESGAPLIGPQDGALATRALPDGYAHVSCLLFDPRRIWRGRTTVFLDHGDPGRGMQESLRASGAPAAFFPFYNDGYAVHLGRATLMSVAANSETTNPLYDWAVTHNTHHYAGYEHGPSLHRQLCEAMQEEVGPLTATGFAAACLRDSRVVLSPAR